MFERCWRLLLVCGIAAGVSGCDSSAKYKAVFADRIEAEQDLLTILKEVRDQKSMEKAGPELRRLSWRLERLKKRFEALPRLSVEEKQEIEKEFVAPLQAVKSEQVTEARRINALPGGEEFLKRLKHF